MQPQSSIFIPSIDRSYCCRNNYIIIYYYVLVAR